MTDSYFQLNAEEYANLIDRLLTETGKLSPTSNHDLSQARQAYIMTALARGAILDGLPKEIAPLDLKQLAEAEEAIPDKQALGWWYRQTSLNQQTRESFAKAGESRSAEMQWDNLFPDGKNEIYLDLSVTAKSLGNKVDDYISAHNAVALEKYAAAQKLDEQSLLKNPKAFPKAGKSIDQQLIRRDPTNPIKMIQTLNPGKQDATWSPPRSLEKFLQDQLEWALYDDLQLEKVDEKQTGKQETLKTKIDLTKVANRDLIAADELFEANELKIVVSRDPQKIGEMSTGQRWRSCMASDGVNFHFVPYDIAAGSLVAYVVHKDDPDARYPLMRQLIKPFHNEKGETILVPARIYGGMENTNSRTRDALRHSLNQFVSKQNEGVTGEFSMDSQLYADGQATTLRLQGEWTFPDIRKAMVEYQGGAIEEWLVELQQAMSHARTNTLGPHGETPEQQIAELKGKLRHVVIADDMADGLPRMFHREMRRGSIGSIPDPKLIKDAISEDSSVVKQSELFNALIKNDTKKVDALLEKAVGGDLTGILQTAAIAAVTSKPGSPAEALAAQKLVWAIECIASTDARTETYLKYARLATHGSLLDELMTKHVIDGVSLIEGTAFVEAIDLRTNFELMIAKDSDCSPALREQALNLCIQHIEILPTPDLKITRYKDLVGVPVSWNDPFRDKLTRTVFDGIMQYAGEVSDLEKRSGLYMDAAAYGANLTHDDEERATKSFMKVVANLPDAERKLHFYRAAMDGSRNSEQLRQAGIAGLLSDADSETDLEQRCIDYKNISQHEEASSPQKAAAFKGILENAHGISDAFTRIDGFYNYVVIKTGVEKFAEAELLQQEAIEKILGAVDELSLPSERVQACERVLWDTKGNLKERIIAYEFKQAPLISNTINRVSIYDSAYGFLDFNSPLRREAALGILDNLTEMEALGVGAKRLVLLCETAGSLAHSDEDIRQRAATEIVRIAANLEMADEKFEAYHNVARFAADNSAEKTMALDGMLLAADTLHKFEYFKTVAWRTSGHTEQTYRAVEGMLKYLKPNGHLWRYAENDRPALYTEALEYTPEGSEQQSRALSDYVECVDGLTSHEQLDAYRNLTNHSNSGSVPWKLGAQSQLRIIQSFDDPDERVAKLNKLRNEISMNVTDTAARETAATILKESGRQILDDMVSLKNPEARVATAKELIEGRTLYYLQPQRFINLDGSYIFDQKSPAYLSEMKYRSIAERIVMAKGIMPLPDHGAGFRLMSFLDRDDISHIIYKATEAVEGIKSKISAICHVHHSLSEHQPVSQSESVHGAAIEPKISAVAVCSDIQPEISDPLAVTPVAEKAKVSTRSLRLQSSC